MNVHSKQKHVCSHKLISLKTMVVISLFFKELKVCEIKFTVYFIV